MAEVTAQLVKQLRDRTGAGMMECKKALEEAQGNLEEAEVVLRKRGQAAAAKKASRSAKQGLIVIEAPGNRATVVEVNCESDFVARTDDFQALAASLLKHVDASTASTVDALLAETFAETGTPVADFIKEKIAKVGENIVVPRFGKLSVASGLVATYIHPGSQLGVAVALEHAEKPGDAALAELGRDLAMQIAAADPKYVSRDQVDPDILAKEADIARDRARNEGKPEKILDKIVEGRLSKFYEEVCLLEQPFIKDNSLSITELIKQKSAALGGAVTVSGFLRYKVGETAPAEEAAE
jgi:elongation factor Ts